MKAPVIIITGTPATGKSSLAKELSLLLHLRHINVNRLVKEGKLKTGYDSRRKVRVVDIPQLKAFLLNNYLKKPHKGLLIESHLAHYLPSKYADLCLVTVTELKTLNHRLKERGYSKAKIRENLDAEIFRTCENEARECNHRVIVVNTTKKEPRKLAKSLLPRIRRELRT